LINLDNRKYLHLPLPWNSNQPQLNISNQEPPSVFYN